jgi:hypothetical protein
MAAGTPLTRLTLGAASVADDLGYVALSDPARALGDIPADFVSSAATWSRCSRHDGSWGTSSTEKLVT